MRLKSGMKVMTSSRRFLVGMSLAFGLISTSTALGNRPLFPVPQYAADDEPRSMAIGDLNGVSVLFIPYSLSAKELRIDVSDE